MKLFKTPIMALILAALFLAPAANQAFAQQLIGPSCADLLRMADSYRDDLKTADTVLGSAIDLGSLDMIKSYKLKKENAKRQLEQVLKALEIKGCSRGK